MSERGEPSSANGGSPAEAPTVGVLFVDIADSTRLYRILGDERARAVVLAALARLSTVVNRHGGRVIDSIGDELMCTFDTAERTVEAATALQHASTHLDHTPDASTNVHVRIGMAVGPVVQDGSRVFGKTVYRAKRMASIAKARQVITTGDTVTQLHASNLVRFLDRVVLKGEQSVTEVWEVLWDPKSATDRRLEPGVEIPAAIVHLLHAGRELIVDERNPEITIGRGESCNLVVAGRDVSWLHARVQCHKGRPTLTDVSTNGTFVLPEGARDSTGVYRDTVPLAGGGYLGLGRPPVSGDASGISFTCRVVT